MLTIIWQTIKDRKISIIVYCLTSILFLWMYIALFPSLESSFDALKEYINSFPKGFLDAFGMDAETFVTFEGYIGSEQFTFVWPIMVITLMISFAGGAISSEIEKGTIEVLLSQPISRLKIFLSKYLAGVFALLVFVLATFISIFPMVEIYDISIKSENFIKLGVLGFVMGLAIFSLSMFFSTIFSEKGRANFIPAGILILMYVLNIIAGLKENLKNLKYGSFFYYYNPSKLLVHGEIDSLAWWIFGGVFLVAAVLALIIFQKRDIAV